MPVALMRADSLSDLANKIATAHDACERSGRAFLRHAVEAGQSLIEAKKQVPHGQWLTWLAENCPTLNRRTAQRYMTVAEVEKRHGVAFHDDFTTMTELLKSIARQKPPTVTIGGDHRSVGGHVVYTPVAPPASTTINLTAAREPPPRRQEIVVLRDSLRAFTSATGPVSYLCHLVRYARERDPVEMAEALKNAGDITAADVEGVVAWLADVATQLKRTAPPGRNSAEGIESSRTPIVPA